MKSFRPIEAISLYPPELLEPKTQLVRTRMAWADKAENNVDNLTIAISEIDTMSHILGLSHGETAAKLEISPATWARLKAGELTSTSFLGASDRPRFQSSTGRAVLYGLRTLCEAWLQASADLRVERTTSCEQLDRLLDKRRETPGEAPRTRKRRKAVDRAGNAMGAGG